MNSNLQLQSLDLLRFPFAVLVVLEHVFNSETIIIQDKIYDIASVSLYKEFLLFVEGFIRGISVPVYFFISGYVFFFRYQSIYEREICKEIEK